MKITLNEVKAVFLDVLEGKMSREGADRWAYSLMKTSEAGELEFSPPEDQERIWSGVMYLYGIDSQVAPGQYLHDLNDIRTAFERELSGSTSVKKKD